MSRYFRVYFNCNGLEGGTCHLYVVGGVGFRWFWGLTCDFWAEFEEIIFATSSFGFRSLPSAEDMNWNGWPFRVFRNHATIRALVAY